MQLLTEFTDCHADHHSHDIFLVCLSMAEDCELGALPFHQKGETIATPLASQAIKMVFCVLAKDGQGATFPILISVIPLFCMCVHVCVCVCV